MNEQSIPIDAVIAWVDGNDPAHKAKRHRYSKPEEISNDDIGGDIRFTSIGERSSSSRTDRTLIWTNSLIRISQTGPLL